MWRGYKALCLSPLSYLSHVVFNLPEGRRIAAEVYIYMGLFAMAVGNKQVSPLNMTGEHSTEVSKAPFTDVRLRSPKTELACWRLWWSMYETR